MRDTLVFAALFVAWIALFRWILPLFGVETCMSGACARQPSADEHSPAKEAHTIAHDRIDEDENTRSDTLNRTQDRSSVFK
jgi:hypothetical protein